MSGFEKCCCFIPLRLGTFLIALWFTAIYLIDATTGFLGINAATIYSGQAARPWYYIDLLFTVIVCLGGVVGMFGSCFASRKFAKAFTVIVWVNCTLSVMKYVICLALMISHRDSMVNACMRSGFIGISNAQNSIEPVVLSESSYYAPVRYPGTLNANAGSEASCEEAVKLYLIVFGAVSGVFQLLQFYFASVVSAYASRLRNGARHHRLHDQQIKDFEESRYHMSTVY
ncbi:hypothetical protein DM01DRAFT_1366365 [Hesseltinella vesiculosa]|uniref:MARVEL domain-containing protein n=1 Tax=Hesseltinella vesiculosa TaxID=101127 RepID=A0A1X2GPH2_9FUNG|nr:hypothetical protein DM01DRAFT_1366365 [Hesseltinella vesiculosa]